MTSNAASNAEVLLSQALAGSRECFGQLLHVYRNYLRLLVMSQLERKLQTRVSPSDVVQETFLDANRDFPNRMDCKLSILLVCHDVSSA